MRRIFLPGTQIEIVSGIARGGFRHVLFDFDGTVSLFREGWQRIMGPVMVETICGDTEPTPDIEAAVYEYIDESTGLQTIIQMHHLVEMVKEFGRVPPERILDAQAYKRIYNGRLMQPVNDRIARLEGYMQDFREGSTLTFSHVPGRGTEIVVDGKTRGIIEGSDFGAALISIWLGDPPNAGLKEGLLGGPCG